MILQLKVSQGKGWDDMDYKEALKQGIDTPDSIQNMAFQFKNLWGLSCFFFGNKSTLSQNLTDLLSLISMHSITLEGYQLRDENFATKFGYAIDTRIFRWLQECQNQESRELVNDSIINFTPLVDQIMMDLFVQQLPATFRSMKEDTKILIESEPVQKKRKQINLKMILK